MNTKPPAPKGADTSEQASFRFFVWSRSFDIVKVLISAIVTVVLGYFALQAVALLAGKTTEASFFLGHFSSAGERLSPWAVTAIAVFWAIVERRLRLRKTEYLQGRLAMLERGIDPGRTTSNLLPNGQTRPEDRIP